MKTARIAAELIALTVVCVWRATAAEVETLPPLARAVGGPAAAIVRGEIWVAGGTYWDKGVKHIDTAVRRRATAGTEWRMAGAVPGGFAHGGWAATDDALWLAGGVTQTGPSRTIWRIDFATGSVAKFAELPEARAHGGAAIFDGALWVVGGTSVDGDFAQTSGAVWRVDLRSGAVTAAPAGPALVTPLVLALGDGLHVFPGGVWNAATQRLDAPPVRHVFPRKTSRWETHPLAGPLPRGLTGVALDERRAWLCGGAEFLGGETAITGGTWVFDAATGVIAAGAPLPAPRYAAAILRDGAALLVLGGEDRPRERAATVWRIQPEGGR
ncbi:MAG: hypothetical protein RLZZ15_2016 [Verrucomicrobiota bacterium]